jgi:hypothetical protein
MPQINIALIDTILNNFLIILFYFDFFNLLDFNDDNINTYNLYLFTL